MQRKLYAFRDDTKIADNAKNDRDAKGGSHGWKEGHLYIFQGQGWGRMNQWLGFDLEISTVEIEEVREEVAGEDTCPCRRDKCQGISTKYQQRGKWQGEEGQVVKMPRVSKGEWTTHKRLGWGG